MEQVVVFKASPICPVSTRAEAQFEKWRAESDVPTFVIDVIAEKPLARGLTALLDIQHESPQALVFTRGDLKTHASHGTLTRDWFAEAVTPSADG